MEKTDRSRRVFITAIGMVAAGLLLRYLTPQIPLDRALLISVPKSDIPPDGAQVFRTERVAVIRDGNTFRAFSLVCTHLGCTVNVTPDGLSCPCHGSLFDRQGRVLRGPADRALPQLRLEMRGDTIEVFA